MKGTVRPVEELPRDRPLLAYARAGGPGDPLLLLHAGWEDRRAWDGLFSLLSTGFEVLACDRRGHGESPAADGPLRVREDARDLADLLEAADLFPTHVAATGSACASAVRLASERPELVRSLLLHEPPFVTVEGGDAANAERRGDLVAGWRSAQAAARQGDADRAARAYLEILAGPSERWDRFPPAARDRWRANALRWAEEMDDPEVCAPELSGVGAVALPVLLTFGEESPPVAGEIVRAVARSLPNAEVRELPGTGHLPHLFATGPLTALWASFLLDRWVPPT